MRENKVKPGRMSLLSQRSGVRSRLGLTLTSSSSWGSYYMGDWVPSSGLASTQDTVQTRPTWTTHCRMRLMKLVSKSVTDILFHQRAACDVLPPHAWNAHEGMKVQNQQGAIMKGDNRSIKRNKVCLRRRSWRTDGSNTGCPIKHPKAWSFAKPNRVA